MRFECHITVPVGQRAIAMSTMALANQSDFMSWHYSEIHGDEALGKRPFGYITTHHDTLRQLQEGMFTMTTRLKQNDVTVLREKIELILHDVRYETMEKRYD